MSLKSICMLLGILLSLTAFCDATERPFIIVSASDYDSLRSKASGNPWDWMKTKAIYTDTLVYDSTLALEEKIALAEDMVSGCALAFILDTTNQADYVDNFETNIKEALNELKRDKEENDDGTMKWSSLISGPFFHAYLALDIMYDSLDSTIRSAIESDCDWVVDNHDANSWLESKYAMQALKELYYNGTTATFESFKDDYRETIEHESSADGVFGPGPGYVFARLYADERPQKKLFMDVCEYQGYNEFYSNEKFQNLYEWLAGYSVAANQRSYTFSDGSPGRRLGWKAATLRLSRFSEDASKYFSTNYPYTYKEKYAQGCLLHYLLTDGMPPDGETPPNRVFENGGAWFNDGTATRTNRDGVSGALWNLDPHEEVAHMHKDVNSFNIVAFEEYIIRNSGYSGWGVEPWDWIHDTAISSNTVIINEIDHSGKEGDGITESITNSNLSYANGLADSAIANGSHSRNFIMLQPVTGVNGYFTIFDEVTCDTTSHSVQAAIHPNSETSPTTTGTTELYDFQIAGCNYSGEDVDVSILLGTQPSSVSVEDGEFGSSSSCSKYTGKYLYSTYNSNANGYAGFTTVIYPYKSGYEPDTLYRDEQTGFDVSIVEHTSSIKDYSISSNGSDTVDYSNKTFKGLSTIYRNTSGALDFLFVRSGTKFIDTQTPDYGFIADSAITIYMEGDTGTVISPGTDVRFYRDGVQGILIDNEAIWLEGAGTNWIEVNVTSGTHSFELTDTDQSVPVSLISLSVIQDNNKVHLSWITASEINNIGFEIERRRETDTWCKVGYIEGKGNSNDNREYQFFDENPEIGELHYRLKLLNYGGGYSYTESVYIHFNPSLPTEYSISQNFPNPFNPTTTISYALPSPSDVTLTVYDITGRAVTTLTDTYQPAATYSIQWNGTDDSGNPMSTGVYFCRLQAGEYSKTIKMVYLK